MLDKASSLNSFPDHVVCDSEHPNPKRLEWRWQKVSHPQRNEPNFWCRGSRLQVFSTGYSGTKIRHAVEKFQEFVVDTRWQEKALVYTAWATKETLAWSHSEHSGKDAAAWKRGLHWSSAAILPGKHKTKESGNSFWNQLHSSFEIVIPAAVHRWFPNRCTTTPIPFWLNSLPASCISFVTLGSPACQAENPTGLGSVKVRTNSLNLPRNLPNWSSPTNS